ncbi:hypothetical protein GWK47_050895 [Chionoecetes opilio]|uniref:Uncharacterized protein n=1 Tax=Chionoecetes opilio TaxID=41210 RepID=A0A8J4Y9K9_CHIOP|nr:hypothetical protein GWK47_050895 [Chionoecetes opilio]
MSPHRGPYFASARLHSNDTSGVPGESGDQGSLPGASISSNFSPPTPLRAAHFSHDTMSPSPLLERGTESDTSQQLMLCGGESVTVDLSLPQTSSTTTATTSEVWSQEPLCHKRPMMSWIIACLFASFDKKSSFLPTNYVALDPAVVRQRALRQHSFFQLHIHLKRGKDLVARDACVPESCRHFSDILVDLKCRTLVEFSISFLTENADFFMIFGSSGCLGYSCFWHVMLFQPLPFLSQFTLGKLQMARFMPFG